MALMVILHPNSEGPTVAESTSPVVMEIVTDPMELARSSARRERFDRNMDWLQAHAPEVFARHRGQCIVVAGEEVFAAETPEEAIAQAEAAHPQDDGMVIHYIPRDKVARI